MKHNIGKLFNILIRERGYDPTTFRHSLVDDPTGTSLFADYKSGIGETFDNGIVTDRVMSEKFGLRKLHEILYNMENRKQPEAIPLDQVFTQPPVENEIPEALNDLLYYMRSK